MEIEKTKEEFFQSREEYLAQDKGAKEQADAQMAQDREVFDKEKSEWLTSHELLKKGYETEMQEKLLNFSNTMLEQQKTLE